MNLVAFHRALSLALTVVVGAACLSWSVQKRGESTLSGHIAQIVSARPLRLLNCADVQAKRPLVLLALGQSNAGNHGAMRGLGSITMASGGRCFEAEDPLPGATGHGGSIWTRLPPALGSHGVDRAVALDLLAVDASSIDDWTSPDSPLRQRLETEAAALRTTGLTPAFVLWQQGEIDARRALDAGKYRAGLILLADVLERAGVSAPIVLAQSTVCRSGPDARLRAVVKSLAHSNPRFLLGPDTDTIVAPAYREDGCHFTAAGLDLAADAWAWALAFHLPTPDRHASRSDR